jgi:hypothetical protein
MNEGASPAYGQGFDQGCGSGKNQRVTYFLSIIKMSDNTRTTQITDRDGMMAMKSVKMNRISMSPV